jgi:hypothetical protein
MVVVVMLVVVECVVRVVMVVEDKESNQSMLNFGSEVQHGHVISDFELT